MWLIDAYALMEFATNSTVGIDANDIARFPRVDAAPIVHGKWIEDTISSSDGIYGIYGHRCSVCYKFCTGKEKYAYCPNCGAKMDGGMNNG